MAKLIVWSLLLLLLIPIVLADLGPKPSITFQIMDVEQFRKDGSMLCYDGVIAGAVRIGSDWELVKGQLGDKVHCKYCLPGPHEPNCGNWFYSLPTKVWVLTPINGTPVMRAAEITNQDHGPRKLYGPAELNARAGVLQQKYSLDLTDGKLSVVNITPIIDAQTGMSFLIALAITLILEGIVAAAYIVITKKSWRILLTTVIGNIASLPIVWFGAPLLFSDAATALIVSEITVFIAEAVLLRQVNKETLSWFTALLLSAGMNIASIMIGGILYRLFLF